MDERDPYAKFDQADPYAKFDSPASKPSISADPDGKFTQYAKDFGSGLSGIVSSGAAAAGQYGIANKINEWAAPSQDMQRGDEETEAKVKAAANGSFLDKAGAVVGGFVSNLGHNAAHMAGGIVAPAALGIVAPEAVPFMFAGQSAGDTKLAIYNRNKQAYIEQNKMSEEDADKQATADADYTGKNALGIGASTATGFAAGMFGTGGQIANIGKGLKDKALAEATAKRIAGKSLAGLTAEEGAVQGAVGGSQSVAGSLAMNQAADNANLNTPRDDYTTSFLKGGVPGVALGSAFGAGHKLTAKLPESIKGKMTTEQQDAELAMSRDQDAKQSPVDQQGQDQVKDPASTQPPVDQEQAYTDPSARAAGPEDDIFGDHAAQQAAPPTAIDAIQNKAVPLGDGVASGVFSKISPDAQLEVAGKTNKDTLLADQSTITQDHANSMNEGQKQAVLGDQKAQEKIARDAENVRQKADTARQTAMDGSVVDQAQHGIKTGDMDMLQGATGSGLLHPDKIPSLLSQAAKLRNMDAIDHLVSLDKSQGLEKSKSAAEKVAVNQGVDNAQPIKDAIAKLHEGQPDDVTMTSKEIKSRDALANKPVKKGAVKDQKPVEASPVVEPKPVDASPVVEAKPVDHTQLAFDAIKNGDEAGAIEAVKNGASLEDSVSDGNGRYPNLVHTAAAKGMVNVLRAVEKRDPGQISKPDFKGNHALTYAKDAETARYIMSVDEKAVHSRNDNGSTPLHQTKNSEVAREMLSHGADINAVNKDGFTPEQSHVHYDNPDMVEAIKPYRIAKEEAAALQEHIADPDEAPAPRKTRRLEVGDSKGEAASGPTHTKEELTGRIQDVLNKKIRGLGDAITKSDLFKVTDRESSKTDKTTHGYVDGDGSVGIVHDNIPKSWSDEQVYGLLKHEIGVHAVLSAGGKEKMAMLLSHFQKLVESGDKDAKAAMDRVPKGTKAEHVQEEGLAYYVQHAKDPSVVARIGIAMKQMARSFTKGMGIPEKGAFMKWLNGMSGKELNMMAGDAIKEFGNQRKVEGGVRKLSGEDVNARDELGNTALHRARTVEEVKRLIDAGADVNAKNDFGSSVMRYTENTEIAKLLIDAGADVNSKNTYGNSELHNAETLEKAKLLIDAGADVNAKNDNGSSVMRYTENTEIAKLLIDAGADVNSKNTYGNSELHNAETLEKAKLLIDAGADVNAKNDNGKTPEDSSRFHGKHDIADYLASIRENKELKEHIGEQPQEESPVRKARRLSKAEDVNARDEQGNTALHRAKTAEEVRRLVAAGANVNARDQWGNTALHQEKRPEILKILIDAGADVNAKNKGGHTALHYEENPKILKILIDAGADISAKDVNGHSKLRNADSLEKAKLLIDAGADVNAKDDNGRSELHNAKTLEKAKLLIDAGADVNAKDDDGRSELRNAKTLEKAKLLIDAGADVNAKDDNGRSELFYADSPEKAKLLIDAGADVNAKDDNGETPEDSSRFHGKHDIAGYLASIRENKELKEHIGEQPQEEAPVRKTRRLSKEDTELPIDEVKRKRDMAYGEKEKVKFMDHVHGISQSSLEFKRRYIDQYVDLDRLIQKDKLVRGDKFNKDLDPTHARLTESNKAGRSIERMNKEVLEPLLQHLAENKVDPKAVDANWAGIHYGNKVEGSSYMTVAESSKVLGFAMRGKTDVEGFKEVRLTRDKVGKAAELFDKTKPGRNGKVDVAERMKQYSDYMEKNGLKESEVKDVWNAVVSEESRNRSSLTTRARSLEALGFDKSNMTKEQALSRLDDTNPAMAKALRMLEGMKEDTQRVYDEAGIVKGNSQSAKMAMADLVLAAHRARSEVADNNLKLAIAKYFDSEHKDGLLMHTERVSDTDSTKETGNHIVPYMENGVERQMVFDKGNLNMMGLGKGLNHQEKMDDWAISQAGKITRFVSNVHTHWAPVFFIKHGIRNMIHGAIAAGYDKRMEGKWMDVVKNAMGASKMIFDSAMGKDMTKYGDEGKLYMQFRDMGGEAIFALSPKSASEQTDEINKKLYPTANRKAWVKATGGYLHMVHALTHSAENNVRFSLFKTALENGIPAKEAINLSRNATVNFNTRGTNTGTASKLYGFFNANIQGTASLGRIMFDRDVNGKLSLNKKGKQILMGGVLVGFAAGMEQHAAGIKPGTMNESELDENLVLGVDGKALKVPLALGLNVPFAIGRIIAEGVHEGHPMDRIANAINAVMKGFLPVGSSGLTAANTYAPTAIDGIISLAANQSGLGDSSIRKEANNNTPTTGSSRNKDNDSAVAKGIAAIINVATGGSEYKPGHLSPTSSDIDFLLNQYAPIPWSMINKAIDAVKGIRDDKPMGISDIPVVSQYVKDTEGRQSTQSVYIGHEKEMNTYLAGISQMEKKPGSNIGEYKRDNMELARAVDMYRDTNKDIQAIHKQIAQLKVMADLPATSSEAQANTKKTVFALQEKVTMEQKRFNERMEKIKESTKR